MEKEKSLMVIERLPVKKEKLEVGKPKLVYRRLPNRRPIFEKGIMVNYYA